jgi:arylsulfatase A
VFGARPARHPSIDQRFAFVAIGIALGINSSFAAPAAQAATPTPSVVFILLDDMGWGDPGVYGGTFVSTPEIDQMATEGMRFTQYYSNGPVCSPTRAGILTGQYPQAFGIRRAIPGSSYRGLPTDVTTLQEFLGAAGYTSTHIGKWHLGLSKPEFFPLLQGYDHSAIYFQDDSNLSYWDPTFLIDDAVEVEFLGEHLTRVTTDLAKAFIQTNQAQPFFMSLWYNAPHVPYEPTPFWEAQYPATGNGRYAAMISDVDDQIGELIDFIDSLGIGADTIVIVTSDNGSSHTTIESNGPFAGKKQDVFEGGIRSPLLIRWPGAVPAGTVNDSVSLGFDFYPTLATHLGAITPGGLADSGLAGRSMLNAWLNNATVKRTGEVFWENKDSTTFFTPLDGELNRFGVRDGDWKLVRQDNDVNATPFLYDLATDPGETIDLAAPNILYVLHLLRQYHNWRFTTANITYGVANIVGQAAVGPDEFILGGGRIDLENDMRFDFNDADFTFQTRLSFVELPAFGGIQTVAERPGSWKLWVDAVRRIRLDVEGPSGNTSLMGSIIPAHYQVDVAFTVFGWRDSNSTVRLYLNHELQQETNEVEVVEEGGATISFGNSQTLDEPFRGVLSQTRLLLLSASEQELRDDDRDRVRNAMDSCPQTWDPLQRDANKNYIGDACEGNGIFIPLMPNGGLAALAMAFVGVAGFVMRSRAR